MNRQNMMLANSSIIQGFGHKNNQENESLDLYEEENQRQNENMLNISIDEDSDNNGAESILD